MQHQCHWLLLLYIIYFPPTQAAVVTDGTLGQTTHLSGPNYSIPAELGQQHGNNLFHSFSHFNIHHSESATFTGPAIIQNVISRVTGGQASHIAGALNSSIPDADFYLLNPAGIVFSDNAQLNINGSFYASTADSLHFNDGSEFNARSPADSLLTTAPVTAFGFLSDPSTGIQLENTRLTVPNGESLTFNAGEVNLRNSELHSMGSGEYTTTLNIHAKHFSMDNSLVQSVATPFAAGGTIEIAAQTVTLQNNSHLESLTASTHRAGTIQIQAGTLTLSDTILNTDVQQGNHILNTTSGKGQSGDLIIVAEQLTLQDGTHIQVATQGEGDSGRMQVQVSGDILLTGYKANGDGSELVALSAGSGSVSDIEIQAHNIQLDNGAVLGAMITSQGHVNDVNIQATEHITLQGETQSAARQGSQMGIIIRDTGRGLGGDVNIQAKSLQVKDGGTLGIITAGQGSGGNINLNVTDTVRLTGISSQGMPSQILLETGTQGQAGTLLLHAGHLYAVDGAQVVAEANGSGDVGNIHMTVADLIHMAGSVSFVEDANAGTSEAILIKSGISAVTGNNAGRGNNGNAGDITLHAKRITFDNDVRILADSYQQGNAGDIHITAEQLDLTGASAIFSGTFSTGDAGDIQLQVEQITLRDSSWIQVDTYDQGNAGSIAIEATELRVENGSGIIAASLGTDNAGEAGNINMVITGDLSLSGVSFDGYGSSIRVGAVNDGNAGNLTIQADNIWLNDGALVDAISEKGAGDAGSVNIRATSTVSLQGYDQFGQSSIIGVSALQQGDAGTLQLQAQRLLLRDGGIILGQAIGGGQAGDISITVTEADFAQQNPRPFAADYAGELQTQATASSGIYANTTNSGNGGMITLTAQTMRLADTATINTSTLGSGNGGEIFINAGRLMLNNANIIADSTAAGNAGHVQIVLDETLEMQNSVINTDAVFQDGGNISLHTGGYIRLTDSQIQTSINAPDGSDGNINIDGQFIALDGSRIIAETANGDAGAINILTQGLFIFPPVNRSEIRATSGLNIEIVLERENKGSVNVLPAEFLEAANLLQKPCGLVQSSFTVAEYGGIGYQPDDLHSTGMVGLFRRVR